MSKYWAVPKDLRDLGVTVWNFRCNGQIGVYYPEDKSSCTMTLYELISSNTFFLEHPILKLPKPLEDLNDEDLKPSQWWWLGLQSENELLGFKHDWQTATQDKLYLTQYFSEILLQECHTPYECALQVSTTEKTIYNWIVKGRLRQLFDEEAKMIKLGAIKWGGRWWVSKQSWAKFKIDALVYDNPDYYIASDRKPIKQRDRCRCAKGKLRISVLERDNYTCLICGYRGTKEELHVDHIIPHSKGGTTTENNLQTLCDVCNTAKGDSDG